MYRSILHTKAQGRATVVPYSGSPGKGERADGTVGMISTLEQFEIVVEESDRGETVPPTTAPPADVCGNGLFLKDGRCIVVWEKVPAAKPAGLMLSAEFEILPLQNQCTSQVCTGVSDWRCPNLASIVLSAPT